MVERGSKLEKGGSVDRRGSFSGMTSGTPTGINRPLKLRGRETLETFKEEVASAKKIARTKPDKIVISMVEAAVDALHGSTLEKDDDRLYSGLLTGVRTATDVLKGAISEIAPRFNEHVQPLLDGVAREIGQEVPRIDGESAKEFMSSKQRAIRALG